ncbi:ABC transporter permease [Jejuia spongiicola]|uniref:ABC transporter permease n=1 Tax=Jejuia spongiicola TaxID=2942207 RepID=A0ABT0QEP3_9FLAO|nr:ABC transporter permease [Jejuia spongiicola]MCL6295446.1 ABC transporter permease [Jejuia spongiicola]
MIRNYFKIAWRNLIKNKGFSAINIGGLSVGLTVSIIISIYVFNEYSYDNFHENYDKLYRVLRIGGINDDKYLIGVTSGPFGPALENDFSESIENTVRVMPNDGLVTYKNNSFYEKKVYLADSNFFEIFSFPLKEGVKESALEKPNSVVLTQEMAAKYFGDEDPMGKILQLDDNFELTVTGIMEDLPTNSHLDFDFIVPIAIIKNYEWFNDWWNNSMLTYALIDSPKEAKYVESNLTGFMDKYFAEDFKKNDSRIDLTLQPFSEVYFNNKVRYDRITTGDNTVVKMFLIIAIFILLIASINFTNLTTARSNRRAREIGVRKVLGAIRSKLIWQFFVESLLLTSISILIAIVLVLSILPIFNSYFDLQLSINFLMPKVILMLVAFLLIVTLIAGSYPALLLSSFRPVKVLKSSLSKSSSSIFIRKGLVVFQFSVSFFLIAGTLLISNQLDFMQSKDKGFDDESVVLVRMNNSDIQRNAIAFKNRLKAEPNIISLTTTSGAPGGFHDTYSHTVEQVDGSIRLRTVFADVDYTKTFGLQIVSGRDFSKDFGTDETHAVLINETSAKNLGWTNEEAIGKNIVNTMIEDYGTRKVVGVVKDYHFSSLKDKIDPLIVTADPFSWLLAIKVNAANIKQAIAQIETQWKIIAPNYPFEYTFLDTNLDKLYRKEQQESQLFIIFSILSILIACLGSFALAAYSAEERTKEVGVRKILGSSVFAIFLLLTKDFVKIVFLAIVITSPFAYYFMNKWLQDFAYQVGVNTSIFITAAFVTVFMVLVTVSWQSIKASRNNPIDSLRYE